METFRVLMELGKEDPLLCSLLLPPASSGEARQDCSLWHGELLCRGLVGAVLRAQHPENDLDTLERSLAPCKP